MTDVATNLARVRARIAEACRAAGRAAEEVTLVAVSKRHPPEAVLAAHAAGQRVFGENYVQELVQKADALADRGDLRWHFIGHLQRNKVKEIVRVGAAVETVDSARLAEALGHRASEAGVSLPVWIQVNVAGESQKSGCAPDELADVVEAVRAESALRLSGLMTVPPYDDDPEASRPWFRKLRELAGAHGVSGLSMGMSGDLEVAVAEGATVVRVGTAIFGPRPA